MRSRGLLVLSLLTLAVGGFIWFVERDLPTTQELEAREDQLFDLDADTVDRVQLLHGGTEVVLQRESSEENDEATSSLAPARPWQLLAPLVARADATSISGLLNQVLSTETLRTLDDGEAEDYGLAPAVLRISLTTPAGTETLEVGNELPASSRRVVRRNDDDRLYVVETPFFVKASQAAGEWRDRKLFLGRESEIQSVRLSGPQGEVLLVRRGRRFWMEAPVSDLAARNEVDALLTTLSSLEAKSFLDSPTRSAVEMGLEPPLAAIEVHLDGSEIPFRVFWGAPVDAEKALGALTTPVPSPAAAPADSTHFARVGDVLVEIDASLEDPLRRSVRDWRSHAWMTQAVYDVERITIGGAESLDLARDGVDWKRGEETISYSTVNKLVSQLAAVRAVELLDDIDVTKGMILMNNSSPIDNSAPTEGTLLTFGITSKDGTLTTLRLFDSGEAGATPGPVATTSLRSVALRLDSDTHTALTQAIQEVREAVREDLALPDESTEAGDANLGVSETTVNLDGGLDD